MSCLQQDGTGDLLLTAANGSKHLTLIKDVADCAAQKLTNRFLLFLGEWFLDSSQGLPFYQLIAVKNPDPTVLERLFTNIVLSVPGVTKVDFLTVKINNQRQASMQMQAEVDGAYVITGGPGSPFVVKR
jgi:hypothetical protein